MKWRWDGEACSGIVVSGRDCDGIGVARRGYDGVGVAKSVGVATAYATVPSQPVPASEAACEYVHKDSQLAAQSVEVELYIRSRIRWAEIKLAYTLVTPEI